MDASSGRVLRSEATIGGPEIVTFVQWSAWGRRSGSVREEAAMSVTASSRRTLEAVLLAGLGELLEEVRAGLADGWPDYADFLEADEQGVGDAAALFVHRLVEMSADEPAPPGTGLGPGDETVHLVFEQIGRQQLQAGNDLTRLLTAFQLGARVAWRHVSAAALETGLPPESLASLADAVFVFVNQLSFSAARGYVSAQVEDARARDRNREELAALLLSDRAGSEATRAAAARADWTLPDRAAVVLVDPDDEVARQVVDRLGTDCLPVRPGVDRGEHGARLWGAIVPEPDTLRGRAGLARQLQGAGAVVGYAVPLAKLPRSCEVARTVADLRRAGVVRGDPVFADEHLDTIIVWRDPPLVEALRAQVLAPLDDLPPGTRERLVETLRCWLRHQGNRHAMAEELSIHPQTVRYRLAQLQERFGDELDSPRSRARLFLALQWPSED
jgi:hypothetical protein